MNLRDEFTHMKMDDVSGGQDDWPPLTSVIRLHYIFHRRLFSVPQ